MIKAIYLSFLFFGLCSCGSFMNLFDAGVKVENFKDLKKDTVKIYYSTSLRTAWYNFSSNNLQHHEFKEFSEIDEEKIRTQGRKTIVIKVLNKNGFADYYLVPKSNHTFRLASLAIGIGGVGLASIYHNKMKAAESFDEKVSLSRVRSAGVALVFWSTIDQFFQFGLNKRKINLDVGQKEIPKRLKHQKFVQLNNIELSNVDFSFQNYKSFKQYSERKKFNGFIDNRFVIQHKSKWNEPKITNNVNNVFQFHGYRPENTVLRDRSNDLLIDVQVINVNYNLIKNHNDLFSAHYELKVVLKNAFGGRLFEKNYVINNVPFLPQTKEAISESLTFAINEAILQFYKEKTFIEELNAKKDVEQVKEIEIISGEKAKSLEEAVAATFTIKTSKGHGSGWLIGEDGYIVTNYHVINDQPKVQVTNDFIDTLIVAKVVKISPEFDLALLKVDHNLNIKPLNVNVSSFPLGYKVYAIGTPTAIELGQSISKGSISSYVTNEQNHFYQLDMKVNPGNSGGPLVLENGDVIAIINAKQVGRGVEKIGYAIAAKQLELALNIIIK